MGGTKAWQCSPYQISIGVPVGLYLLSYLTAYPSQIVMNNPNEQSIIEKLRLLPPERIIEVEDFVDFLHARDIERNLVKQAGQTSAAVFNSIWENADDSEYDRL